MIGPDTSGNVVQVLVYEQYANSCEKCTCQKLYADCLFGPDSQGNLVESKQSYLAAENCERSSCVCSTHDGYEEIWQRRIAESTNRVEQIKDEIASGRQSSSKVTESDPAPGCIEDPTSLNTECDDGAIDQSKEPGVDPQTISEPYTDVPTTTDSGVGQSGMV